MDKAQVIEQIETEKIMPVIRTNSADQAKIVSDAILGSGLNVLEVTMSVPNALELIKYYSLNFSDSLVGAGTVLDKKTAEKCIKAGARFIVSPVYSIEIIRFCNKKDITIICGAATPTEVYKAWRAGADFVKVFPVSAFGGSTYLKALRDVFPEIKLIPTGGVTIENMEDFLAVGAKAVGIGGHLTNGTLMTVKHNCEVARAVLAKIRKKEVAG